MEVVFFLSVDFLNPNRHRLFFFQIRVNKRVAKFSQPLGYSTMIWVTTSLLISVLLILRNQICHRGRLLLAVLNMQRLVGPMRVGVRS